MVDLDQLVSEKSIKKQILSNSTFGLDFAEFDKVLSNRLKSGNELIFVEWDILPIFLTIDILSRIGKSLAVIRLNSTT